MATGRRWVLGWYFWRGISSCLPGDADHQFPCLLCALGNPKWIFLEIKYINLNIMISATISFNWIEIQTEKYGVTVSSPQRQKKTPSFILSLCDLGQINLGQQNGEQCKSWLMNMFYWTVKFWVALLDKEPPSSWGTVKKYKGYVMSYARK